MTEAVPTIAYGWSDFAATRRERVFPAGRWCIAKAAPA